MDAEILLLVIESVFNLKTMLVIVIGVASGIMIGALPGLSAPMAIALLIPVTFGMGPIEGLILLMSIYTAAIYGGSITAILIHTPGTSSSAASAIEGYKLTQKGYGAKALGVSTISSVIGGLISAVALLFLAPPLSIISLKFSASEYFLIAIFGLTVIGAIASGSLIKGLMSGVIGLFIGTVGVDVLTGYPRYTFGLMSFESGISFVPAMIGLFSLSQVMILAESKKENQGRTKVKGKVLPNWQEFKSIFSTIIRSSGIGTFIGILPGAGSDIGSWVAYNEAKRFSKKKEEYGKGSLEGLSAPEAANNAVTGGALIPLLTLGIPGSSTTAVLLGGLMVQGLVPGRTLFTENADTTYPIIFGFIVATILMGIIGLLGARHFVKVTQLSSTVLIPIIVGLSVVGSYAIANSFTDIWIMIAFGFIGYFLRKTGFHPAPVVLGMILGPIMELSYRQSILMAKGNVLAYYFSRPISVFLILLIILTLVFPILMNVYKKRKQIKNT